MIIECAHIESLCGGLAAVTSLIGLAPQLYKTYQTKSARDLSMWMLLNYAICSAAWVGYSLCTKDFFVLVSNIIGLIVSLISIGQKKYYDTQFLSE